MFPIKRKQLMCKSKADSYFEHICNGLANKNPNVPFCSLLQLMGTINYFKVVNTLNRGMNENAILWVQSFLSRSLNLMSITPLTMSLINV